MIRVRSLHSSLRHTLIHKAHAQILRAADYMVIGDHQKLRIGLTDDDAGAAALAFISLCLAEHALHFLDALIRNGYQGRHSRLRDSGYACATVRIGTCSICGAAADRACDIQLRFIGGCHCSTICFVIQIIAALEGCACQHAECQSHCCKFTSLFYVSHI